MSSYLAQPFKPLFRLVLSSLFAGLIGCTAAHSATDYSGEEMPYEAFKELGTTDIKLDDGSLVHVAFAPGQMTLSHEQLLDWVKRSAHAVMTYYGHFPVKSVELLLVPHFGDAGVQGGATYGHEGPAMRVYVGALSTPDDLTKDWVMVHEMIHLAFPRLDHRHAWLHEGISVYVESIARVQAGDLPAEQVWADFVRAMPKGLPQAGDQGFDNTDSWGRTYWGGAMFCLMADIAIRKATANKVGLQDALRGVQAAGGNFGVEWPITDAISVADKAIALDTLEKMYAEMKDKPVKPDLAAIFKSLGVVSDAPKKVHFDDTAELSAIRRAITEKRVFN